MRPASRLSEALRDGKTAFLASLGIGGYYAREYTFRTDPNKFAIGVVHETSQGPFRKAGDAAEAFDKRTFDRKRVSEKARLVSTERKVEYHRDPPKPHVVTGLSYVQKVIPPAGP